MCTPIAVCVVPVAKIDKHVNRTYVTKAFREDEKKTKTKKITHSLVGYSLYFPFAIFAYSTIKKKEIATAVTKT